MCNCVEVVYFSYLGTCSCHPCIILASVSLSFLIRNFQIIWAHVWAYVDIALVIPDHIYRG